MLKKLLGIAVVLALIFVAAVMVSMWQGDAERDAVAVRAGKIASEIQTRKFPRTVLLGEGTPGNAWEEYTLAIKEAQLPADGVAPAFELALGSLHRGVERSDGQYPYAWNDGFAIKLPDVAGGRRLAAIAVEQAKYWAETGRAKDAMDLMVDTGMFGRDWALNAPLVSHQTGVGIASSAVLELGELITSGRFDMEELAELAGQLETLDREFPRLGPAFVPEALGTASLGSEAARQKLFTDSLGRMVVSWRYGFSFSRMVADAFETSVTTATRLQKVDEMSFADVRKLATDIAAQRASSPNPVLQIGELNVLTLAVAQRELLARLRIARVAATFLATGGNSGPAPPDPFGGTLLFEPGFGTFRIWSVGGDGQDQHGLGGWASGSKAGGDIVLEIPVPQAPPPAPGLAP